MLALRSAVVLALFLYACGQEPQQDPAPTTEVRIVFELDPQMEADVDRFAVDVFADDSPIAFYHGAKCFDPDSVECAPVPAWPLVLPTSPMDDDPSHIFRVEAKIENETSTMGTVRARYAFVAGQRRFIRLRFDQACLDKVCTSEQTCIEGACERACFSAEDAVGRRSEPTLCPDACGCASDEVRDDACIPRETVRQLSLGDDHACAITAERDTEAVRLRCWGRNQFGQVGDGTSDNALRPVDVSLPEGLSLASAMGDLPKLAAGRAHTCAINSQGNVFCWGNGSQHQLGGDAVESQPQVTAVPAGESSGAFTMVTAGAIHTCGISEQSIYCWGANEFGQLGVGDATGCDTDFAAEPRQVSRPVRDGTTCTNGYGQDYVFVSAGLEHTCALSTRIDGNNMRCWGRVKDGRTSVGEQSSIPPEQSCIFDGGLCAPRALSGRIQFESVSAGSKHTLGIGSRLKDSTDNLFMGEPHVITFGLSDGRNGRSGYGAAMSSVTDPDHRMVSVAAGDSHSCAAGVDGTLSCTGSNRWGQLGTGPCDAVDGCDLDTFTPVTNANDWKLVAAGRDFTCGVRADGTLWCWGANGSGQLGLDRSSADPARAPERVCLSE